MSEYIGSELFGQVQTLRNTIELVADRIPAEVTSRAERDLEQVVRRLELGVHHVVVALVGGTGSGKSSLFNAITRLDFADVGVIRPTTSKATACTWHTDSNALLDFLGADPKRRIQHESALTQDGEADLSGLVLLDLPDHDSVKIVNAELVDRLLPMIDLLVWVVDPQKYADNVLHEKYLQELTDRHEAMLVVVNQVDTVHEAGLDQIRTDVRRLLAEDDLEDVPVLLASAKTGHGVGMIRSYIGEMMAGESIAARTARDELRAIARRLKEVHAPATPALPQTQHVAGELASSAGIPAIADSIYAAVAGGGKAALSPVQAPATSRIEAIRETWVEQVAGGMPALWRERVASTVVSREPFYQHIADALESVRLPPAVDTRARFVRFAGLALLIIGVILAAVGAVLDVNLPLIIAGGAVALVGLIAFIVAKPMRAKTARSRKQGYLDEIERVLSEIVHHDLEEPARAELIDHEAVLEATRF